MALAYYSIDHDAAAVNYNDGGVTPSPFDAAAAAPPPAQERAPLGPLEPRSLTHAAGKANTPNEPTVSGIDQPFGGVGEPAGAPAPSVPLTVADAPELELVPETAPEPVQQLDPTLAPTSLTKDAGKANTPAAPTQAAFSDSDSESEADATEADAAAMDVALTELDAALDAPLAAAPPTAAPAAAPAYEPYMCIRAFPEQGIVAACHYTAPDKCPATFDATRCIDVTAQLDDIMQGADVKMF